MISRKATKTDLAAMTAYDALPGEDERAWSLRLNIHYCSDCHFPMKPGSLRKTFNFWDHAGGCPNKRNRKKWLSPQERW